MALLCILRKGKKRYYINPTLLSYELWDKYPPSRQMISSTISGMKTLIEKEIITVDKDVGKDALKNNEWIIETSLIYDHDKADFFTNMTVDETRKILGLECTHAKSISMLRFYNYILSTLHKKKTDDAYGVGFTSIENMVSITGLNQKTIYSYLSELEQHELIYVYRPKITIIKKNGAITEIPATYGRYVDKNKIDQIGVEYEEKQQAKSIPRNGNNNRALSQKYVHISKCVDEGRSIPDKYKNDLEDIYQVAYELNKKYQSEGRKDKTLKDLSMFKEYKFYKGEY